MATSRRVPGVLFLFVASGACGESSRPPVLELDGAVVEAGVDAGTDLGVDAPVTPDAGATDTGSATDAPDVGPAVDVGCTGTRRICNAQCVDTASDHDHCGACARACAPAEACVSSSCVTACTAGQVLCAGTCRTVATDPAHCGGCGVACPAGVACVAGTCDQAFAPTENPTFLASGSHSFTSVRIPAGVVVMIEPGASSTGTLDLRVSGDVVIDGSIDVSGGAGTSSTNDLTMTSSGRAGVGGHTGTPRAPAAGPLCGTVAGAGGLGGAGAFSNVGTCVAGSVAECAPSPFVFAAPLTRAGGGGVFTGLRAYGAGGGGPAGGGAGSLEAIPEAGVMRGQVDCMGVIGGGGTEPGRGGSSGVPEYDGDNGTFGRAQCAGPNGIPAAFLGGGGGGSIGAAAAADLAVATTFGPGSGGGGGSADHAFRPGAGGTSGGGGGGGALRITSATRITVSGSILANGGIGGAAAVGTGTANGCDPPPGAAGGAGSGGVIFLRAPQITTTAAARVSAVGGAGRLPSAFATGGRGGAGGLGRIRLSVTPASCSLAGTFAPPLMSGCAAASAVGATYVAAYPD